MPTHGILSYSDMSGRNASSILDQKQVDLALKTFYTALNDRPLEPDDKFYLKDLHQESGGGDPIADLARQIIWDEGGGVYPFTGQRGTGKSTELRRLRKLLEEQGCVVFLADMAEYMNLTSAVEVSDFLITIFGALSEKVRHKYQQDPGKQSFWDRICKFLNTEVKLDEMELGVDGASFKLSLKEDPDFRSRLQERMRGHIAKLVSQSRQFALSVAELVRAQERDLNKKVVLLIDSVERIRGVGDDAEQVYKSVENLFSGHADKLRFPPLHVVYTVPPYLNVLAAGVGAYLGGGAVYSIPSVHLFERCSRKSSGAGLKVMKEIVARRYRGWQKIYEKESLERLALASGGDLRDYFRLIRISLTKAATPGVTLPIGDAILGHAENMVRNEMLPLAEEDMKWLKCITTTWKTCLDSIKNLPTLARYFETKLVLNYRNGDDWYDVHPLLRQQIDSYAPPTESVPS
jgi:hypothetical protein